MAMSESSENTHKSDDQLILEVQKGSSACFKVLYDRYKDLMYRYVYHIVGHRQSAEDCTHDIFVRAYEKAKSYKPEGKFIRWLYRIARNMALNIIRKRRNQSTASLNQPPGGRDTVTTLENLIEGHAQHPAQVIESRDVLELLRWGFQKLAEKDRQVIVLCAVQGMPHKEVAAILKWPEDRVAVQLHRARARYRGKGP
jgi:RNA polymerase sigma-70 factor, ECF subfamily